MDYAINVFNLNTLKDLFNFTKSDEDEEPTKKESEDMPKWAKKLMETLAPQKQTQPEEIPVPPAPKTVEEEQEQEEQEEQKQPNPLKKMWDWLM